MRLLSKLKHAANRFAKLLTGLRAPKLSAVMAIVFVCLSIPVLISITVYNYQKNAAAIVVTFHQAVSKTIQVSIQSAEDFINPVSGTLLLLAGISGVDRHSSAQDSADVLYLALIFADQIDAIYVSFEDGYHRVVTRINAGRRRSDFKMRQLAFELYRRLFRR